MKSSPWNWANLLCSKHIQLIHFGFHKYNMKSAHVICIHFMVSAYLPLLENTGNTIASCTAHRSYVLGNNEHVTLTFKWLDLAISRTWAEWWVQSVHHKSFTIRLAKSSHHTGVPREGRWEFLGSDSLLILKDKNDSSSPQIPPMILAGFYSFLKWQWSPTG